MSDEGVELDAKSRRSKQRCHQMVRGRKILVAGAAVSIAIPATMFAARGTSIEQIRIGVRVTGIVGFVFFTLPFTASAWIAMAPSDATRWLRSRRRYLGIAFAIAMAIHVSLVIWLVRVSPKVPAAPIIFIVGGIGYAFIAALFATSFDAPTDWLGPRRWRRLHVTGLWYLWTVFVLVFAGGLPFAPMLYSVLLAMAFGGAAMRWAHRRRRIALRVATVAARAN